MKKDYHFDLYFNHNAEDHYLVESISQHFRDKGMATFDRSVDQLPDRPQDVITESDALDQSLIMIAVLTENSFNDPHFEDMVAKAEKTGKPIIVMRFGSSVLPSTLASKKIIESNRENLHDCLAKVGSVLETMYQSL